jgi:hypothetical protein
MPICWSVINYSASVSSLACTYIFSRSSASLARPTPICLIIMEISLSLSQSSQRNCFQLILSFIKSGIDQSKIHEMNENEKAKRKRKASTPNRLHQEYIGWMVEERTTRGERKAKKVLPSTRKTEKLYIQGQKDITIRQRRRHGRRQFKDIEMFLTNHLTVMCLL